jgi:hypothetical protein
MGLVVSVVVVCLVGIKDSFVVVMTSNSLVGHLLEKKSVYRFLPLIFFLTGAPQGSYSSSLQQMNPLSPPDILPQPILPSPLKPMSDIQLPVQEVSTEVSIPKHDVHPRSRESPIIHRKQV